MIEVTINGDNYRIGKMDARRQFHVTRKIAPLLSALGSVGLTVGTLGFTPPPPPQEGQAEAPTQLGGAFIAFMGPLMEKLADMPTADLDFVIDSCFAVASKQQGDRWAPLMSSDGKTFMFGDMDMPTMLQITVAGLQENLGNFFDLVAGLGG